MIRQPHSAFRQRGQAVFLGLALLLTVVLALFAFYQSSRAIDTKARVRYASDAAALSAAVWRARVLNAVAYANRAIIAQDVAVAQAVTLASWAGYAEGFAERAQALAGVYPPAATLLSAISTWATQARVMALESADAEIAWRTDPLMGHRAMLEQSQAILLASADSFGLSAVANEVSRTADSRVFAFVMGDGGEFSRFVRPQSQGHERARTADLVIRSLDGFTGGSRELDLRLLPLPSSCAGQTTHLDRWTHWYRKRGGTELSSDLSHWTAADTGSIHDWRRKRFLFGSCRDVESVPIGGGFAQARDGEDLRGGHLNPGRVLDNPAAFGQGLGLSQTELRRGFSAYPGIGTVLDLSPEAMQSQYPARSRLAVLARLDSSRTSSAEGEAVGAGRLSLAAPQSVAQAWSLSAAEVYFSPPPGIADHGQSASLFSPYWQARLVEPSEAQRQAAQAYVGR